jgi:hypothetical protein
VCSQPFANGGLLEVHLGSCQRVALDGMFTADLLDLYGIKRGSGGNARSPWTIE